MADNSILRTEENGLEFFTIVATGECGVSERGLSLMAGIPKTTTNRWFLDLSHAGVPKWLEPLRGMDLYLPHEIVKCGKQIKPINAKASAKFLGLVAKNLKTDEAIASLDAFVEIGLTSYIQSKTGWLPDRYKAAPEAHDRIGSITDKLDFYHRYQRLFHDASQLKLELGI